MSLALPELRLDFGVTPLALPFLALLALLAPAIVLFVARRDRATQLPLLVAFIGTMIAVLLAQSVAAFALAWEAMTLVAAFLVATHHERRAVRRALLSYLIVGHIGALCIFSALALLGMHAQSYRFADIVRAAASLPPDLRTAVVALALAGFGSKAGLLPLQFWLPRAHPVAPAAASALLSGAMLKVAVYGLLTVCLALASPVSAPAALAILLVGLLTAVAGALYAAVESDLKRLLAFSSIENIGIIVGMLGFALTARAYGMAPVAALALAALLFHAIAHGIFKSLLFLAAGEVSAVAHTTDLEHLGGLARALRYGAPALFVGCLAAAALPPTSGFASEWLLFQPFLRALLGAPSAMRGVSALAAVCLALASGLAAIAFVKVFGIGMLGSARSTHPRVAERFGVAACALWWLALLCVVLGVAPWLALRPLFALAGIAAVPSVPVWIAALPVAGALGAVFFARMRGVRRVETWTCGSAVTVRSQYTASAFAHPLRVLFGDLTRSFVDRLARDVAAVVQRFARRTRIVQAGYLRVYLAYALVALITTLVVAR